MQPTGTLLAVASLLVAGAAGELRRELVIVTHRHGDRSPVDYLPANPNNKLWNLPPGMLTGKGMAELHELGKDLKARYGDLAGTNYTRVRTYVRSTNFDRTLMSAQSLLSALYPLGSGPLDEAGAPALPSRQQPVPVHSVRKSNDRLLHAYGDGICPRYDGLRRTQEGGKVWKDEEKAHADLLAHVGAWTGLNRTIPLRDIFLVADPLICDHAHGYPLMKPFTPAQLQTLQELNSFTIKMMFESHELRRLGGGNLVGEITRRLAKGAGVTESDWPLPIPLDVPENDLDAAKGVGTRFVEYSSHDTTVAALLAALGVFNGKQPPYGSSVVVELLRDPAASGLAAYHVRVYYNEGTPAYFNTTVTPCGEGVETCPLTKWMEAVKPIVPANWEAECQTQAPEPTVAQSKYNEVVTERTVLAVALAVVLAAATAVVCIAMARLRKRSQPEYTMSSQAV